MRILSFGINSDRPEYPRHRNLVDGLRLLGAEVLECHHPMASSFGERYRSSSSLRGAARFGLRLFSSYLALARAYPRGRTLDAILIGHPGFFHLDLARHLRRATPGTPPLLYDMFYSLHDTVVQDRRLMQEGGLFARLLAGLDRHACRAADLCLTDTIAHADFFAGLSRLPSARFSAVPVGSGFPPYEAPPNRTCTSNVLSIVFVGTYIPLQGVDVILEAARLLDGKGGYSFTLIGSGQLRREMEEKSRASGLRCVKFQNWEPFETLGEVLRTFDTCLGIFGTSLKARRVIPHKVYDACSAGVPLVTADTPAVREALAHGETAWLVPPGDPVALAESLRTLRDKPGLRDHLAAGALRTAKEDFSLKAIGAKVLAAAEEARAARNLSAVHP